MKGRGVKGKGVLKIRGVEGKGGWREGRWQEGDVEGEQDIEGKGMLK